jgi:hypothetical protein
MMPLYIEHTRSRTAETERGAVILMLLIITMTSLMLIGLAIDSGNLFHSSLILQKAIDAGALAGAKRIAVVGKQIQSQNPTAFISSVEDSVRGMINANMSAMRKRKSEYGDNQQGDPLRYSINIDLVNDTVQIKANWTVNLIFLGYLPGFNKQTSVQLSTKAQVQRSMVSLLLDSSGSMLCPADGSDCSCMPLCPGELKLDRLRTAVANFATQFNANRDMIQIVYFSLGAFTALPMVPTGGFNLDHVKNALNKMVVQGATDQCDALVAGYLGTRAAVTEQGGRKNVAYVLFSDGAPKAARFFFSHPTLLPVNSVLSLANAGFDYYNWSVYYRDPADPAPLTQSPQLPMLSGTMELARAGLVPYNWPYGAPPDATNGGTADSRVSCSHQSALDPTAAFSQCLSDFGFYDLGGSGKVWGAVVPFNDYREQYYNCVIANSDALRDDGGIVYTVGLGAPALSSSDPYQNAADDTARKDYFFTRVANDPNYKNYPLFPDEFAKYIPASEASHLSEGQYLALDNAAGIDQIFAELYDLIVRKVKTVQLIQ